MKEEEVSKSILNLAIFAREVEELRKLVEGRGRKSIISSGEWTLESIRINKRGRKEGKGK